MAQQVTCPGCQAVYKLPDNSQGKQVKIKCKKCDHVFVAGKSGSPASTGVQAAKKPAPRPASKSSSTEPASRRTATAPARGSSSCILLVLAALFVFVGVGALGAAVGGFFLFFRSVDEPTKVVQNQQPAPGAGDVQKVEIKDKQPPDLTPKDKTPTPIPEPKEKTPTPEPKEKTPTPEPKEKTPTPEPKEKTPTPEPKEKTPTPEPKEKTPTPEPKEKTPTPEPKEKTPTPEPKEKTPTPEPKEKTPMPPVIAALYQLKDPPTPPEEFKLPESASEIVLTLDGKMAVVGVRGQINQERRVLVVELPSGKVLKTFLMPDMIIHSLLLMPDAKTVLIGGFDDRFNVQPQDRIFIRVLSLKTMAMAGFIKGPRQSVVAMSASADGTMLACAESNFTGLRGVVRIINPKTGVTTFYKEKVHTNLIKGIGLTPDKKYVISTGVDSDTNVSKVVVFDAAAGNERFVLKDYRGAAENMAVSSDGKYVAAAINAGNGGSVRVWDIENGAEKLALISKDGNRGASRVVFGPDNKSILATFYDGSTRTFNIENGNEEGGFRGHTLMPNVLANTADGATVVTAYFREVKVWQFPDSLKKLTMPDQGPLFDIVRDGKAVEIKGPQPGVKDEKNFTTFVNVTVDALNNKNLISFVADGKPGQVMLRPESKYFDADGKQVAAEEAPRIYRLGNLITIKAKKEFQSPVAEVRLVKEGPAETTVEGARLRGSGFPVFIFALPGKELRAKLAPDASYVDHEGKAISAKDGKFFNEEDIYAFKLKLVAGEDLPILIEARLTPEKGDLPVFRKYPLGIKGAKAYKNVTLKRITMDGSTRPVIVVDGEEPIPFTIGANSKTYDVKGNAVGAGQFVAHEDFKIDAVLAPGSKIPWLVEARALVPFPAPPPVAKKIVDYKDVAVARIAGGKSISFKFEGKTIVAKLEDKVKATDKDGKEITADKALQTGNRIDAKLEEAGNDRVLIEVRLVEDNAIVTGKQNFKDVEVTRATTQNIYTLKLPKMTVNVIALKDAKFFDADGNPSTAEQVLRVGNKVDAVIEIRAKNSLCPLFEARISKNK